MPFYNPNCKVGSINKTEFDHLQTQFDSFLNSSMNYNVFKRFTSSTVFQVNVWQQYISHKLGPLTIDL